MRRGVFKLLIVSGMLSFGTIVTTLLKAIQDTKFQNKIGQEVYFSKSCTPTLLMFIGESFCLIIFFSISFWLRYSRGKDTPSSSDTGPPLELESMSEPSVTIEGLSLPAAAVIVTTPPGESTREECGSDFNLSDAKKVNPFIFIVFAMFDLLGTTFGTMGLLRTTASVYQMLRGSIIIFTGILSIIFLKRKLAAPQWLGIATVVSGLALVGSESLLVGSNTVSSPIDSLIGMLFIICGQLCNSIQFILEDRLLKDHQLSPAFVVGMEGMWGALLTSGVLLPVCNYSPGSDEGSFENVKDTLHMFLHSPMLVGLCAIYCIAMSLSAMFGMSITKHFTAVTRTVMNSLRTLFVWVVEIITFYALIAKDGRPPVYGESWSKYSFLELCGFLLLVVGTAVYNKSLVIPCLEPTYSRFEDDDAFSLTPRAQLEAEETTHGFQQGEERNVE